MLRETEFPAWQTPEQRKATAEIRARHDAATRLRCNLFRFWRVCRDKPCRRAQTCVGDMHKCFERHWRALSEEERQWLRAWLVALAEGKTPGEAARFADAEAARFAAFTEKLRAQAGAGTLPA